VRAGRPNLAQAQGLSTLCTQITGTLRDPGYLINWLMPARLRVLPQKIALFRRSEAGNMFEPSGPRNDLPKRIDA